MHRFLSGLFAMILSAGLAAAQETNVWKMVADNQTGERSGSTLLFLDDIQLFLLVGAGKDPSFVKTFDAGGAVWKDFNTSGPRLSDGKIDEIHPYYQSVYDSATQTVFCLSGKTLHAFDVTNQTWKKFPPAPELDDLQWQSLACDSAGKRLVVIGADKRPDNLGWMRTVVFDIPTGKWQRLDIDNPKMVDDHKARVAGREALIDLGGRIRLTWYRDPRGIGSDAERNALRDRALALNNTPAFGAYAEQVARACDLLAEKQLLEALRTVRAIQRKLEEQTEALFPVPSSRRNSPLVFDEKNKVFVLFGGDHEDYLMNDTWILDLNKKAWRRAKVDLAPSPRAGHALVYLPKSGKIALYGGYIQNDSRASSDPSRPLLPVQLWLFDVGAERWDLAGSWMPPDKGDSKTPTPAGHFYGYSANLYSPPPLAAGSDDLLVLATDGDGRHAGSTWSYRVDATKVDADGREKLGAPANQRSSRTGYFLADFCETLAPAPEVKLDELPANQWVKLPAAPRNPCAHRHRDWATAVWDADRDQILLWGGGRGARSASTVVHYSPLSGRFAEGFDADEPYARMGASYKNVSLWNRPWVPDHINRRYAYDAKSKLMISATGHLYDPERMDWRRLDPAPPPFRASASVVLTPTKHGVLAWGEKNDWGKVPRLWLYDRERGWLDVEHRGPLVVPYSGKHGMTYDSKRDRVIASGVGGQLDDASDGSLLTYDFATKKVDAIVPANNDLNKATGCLREAVYVDHADWVLIGQNVHVGNLKTGKSYTRVYDCGKNAFFLLDAGPVASGANAGWVYDARRQLVYALNHVGEAWALRIDPATAVRFEKLP